MMNMETKEIITKHYNITNTKKPNTYCHTNINITKTNLYYN